MFSLSVIDVVNSFFATTGIGICVLILVQISLSAHMTKVVQRFFQVFFLFIILYISMHFLREVMDGMSGDGIRTGLQVTTFVEMVAAGLMAATMSLLVIAVTQVQEDAPWIVAVPLALLGVHVLLLAIDLPHDTIYYFDANNTYHRGARYLLSNLSPLLIIIMESWLLVRYRDNVKPHVRSALWAYIIAPVVAIVIQGLFYGIQFIIVATVGAAVYLFTVILRSQNEEYERQQRETMRLGTELSMATDIQTSQLPHLFPAFPERPEFDIYASMTPAKEVGGDFYDFFMVDDDHIVLVMADVSDKGVPAALFMMVSRVLIKSHMQSGETLSETLEHVNDQLCEGNDAMMFVTLWIAVLEISTGKGIAANAGHEHPVLCRAGGNFELVKYPHSPALATIDGIPFMDHPFELHPGDSIFVYTDGVAEASNANKELLGTDRMLDALNRNPDAEPEAVLANVSAGIKEFVQDAEQFDDITMLCLKYYGPKE